MASRKVCATTLVLVMVLTSMTVLLTEKSENALAAPDGNEPAAFRQVIGDMLGNVSASSLYSLIYDLQNFTTRFVYSSKNNVSAQYIHSYFSNYSTLDVESHYFDLGGVIVRNVIATLPAFNPANKSVYIIGGHFDSVCYTSGVCDSFTDPETPAPGADDDATGTAVAMEAARVMSQYKYNATIVFAAWNAEEIGLVGSYYYAMRAREQNMDVKAMLQYDMIGYNPTINLGLDINTDAPSEWIADAMIAANTEYGLGLTLYKNVNPGARGSDHASFWDMGYHAVMAIEHTFNTPNYHKPTDTIDKLNMTLIERTAKSAVATLGELAGVFAPGVGAVVLDKSEYGVSSTVGITLYETDLNADPGVAESALVNAASDSEPSGEIVMLTETGANTSVFQGSIALTQTPTVGMLEVAHGDIINVSYVDANPAGIRSAKAVVDGVFPVISDVVAVPEVTTAKITWKTDEEANSTVYYDVMPPLALSNDRADYVTDHEINLYGLAPDTTYLFDVLSSDPAGNTAVDDNGGLHYTFRTMSGISVTPEYGYVGWVRSTEATGNHFTDPQIMAGHSDKRPPTFDVTYKGAAQFHPNPVPPGATITNATVRFYGDEWVYNEVPGSWNLTLLNTSIDSGWTNHAYSNIAGAAVDTTVLPTMVNSDLAVNEWDEFYFTHSQYSILESRVNTGNISFRIDGPAVTFATIFAWSSGNVPGGGISPEAPRLTITYSTTGDAQGPIILGPAADPNPTWDASEVLLTATATDGTTGNSDIVRVEYYVGFDPGPGNGVPMMPLDGGLDSVTEDTMRIANVSALAYGLHTVYIRARDSAGNWGPSEPMLLNVTPADTAPPEIKDLKAEPSPQEVLGFVNVSANITDDIGIVGTWLNLTRPDATRSNQTMTRLNDVNYLNDSYDLVGTYDFVVWAADVFGRWNSSAGQFETVDTIPPEIAQSVDPGILETPGRVNVSAMVSDLIGVYGAWINISMPGSAWLNKSMDRYSPTDFYYNATYDVLGKYDFVIWANDTSGNWNFSMGTFDVVDATKPSITDLLALPSIQELYQNVNVSANVTDNDLVAGVWINLSSPGGIWTNTSFAKGAGDSYYLEQTYNTLGKYTFVIWASDPSDNWNSVSGEFDIVDTTKPSITDVLALPSIQELNQNVNVSANVTDNDLVASAWINLSSPGGIWTNTSFAKGAGDSYYLEQTYNTLGKYTFVIWASDPSDNWNSVSGEFDIVDTTRPAITDLAEAPDPQELNGNVNVTAKITDSTGIDRVFINVAGKGNFTMNLAGGDLFFYNAAYSATGTHTYVIWARDTSGNWNSASSSFVVQDTTNPIAVAGSNIKVDVNSTVAFNGSGSTDNSGTISSYTWTISLHGISIETLTGVSASYKFTKAGNYTVTLTVTDPSGNAHADTITVAVMDKAQPPDDQGEGTEGFDLWWLVIILIVAVVLILLLLLLMKRRRKTLGEEMPGDELKKQGTERNLFDEEISEEAIEEEARKAAENRIGDPERGIEQ